MGICRVQLYGTSPSIRKGDIRSEVESIRGLAMWAAMAFGQRDRSGHVWAALVDEDVSNKVGPITTVVEADVAPVVGDVWNSVLPDKWRPLTDQQVVIDISLDHHPLGVYALEHEPDQRLWMHIVSFT